MIKEWGIVGSGGAGFPAHVKLGGPAEILLINAAECEPLMHKDKEILAHHTARFFEGVTLCRNLLRAERCILGIKRKYADLIRTIGACCSDQVEIIPLDDFYPAGDEITLIYETTGRVVPAGELPGAVGVVVQNVETLYNIGAQRPVISKFVTVAGAVARPMTLEVPLGTPFTALIAKARPVIDRFDVMVGGTMMGRIAAALDEPVTKTTGGLIVLPPDHTVIRRHRMAAAPKTVALIGKTACDQCAMCTDLCPRYLLGHPVTPHQAMRGLLFSDGTFRADPAQSHALACCECNLCTLIACPEGLYPAQATIFNKRALAADGIRSGASATNRPHPLIGYRRTPLKKVMARLDLNRFTNKGPLLEWNAPPATLHIMLRQHIGSPADPLIKPGDTVAAGQKIATVGERLGAEIHAPADGRVAAVTAEHVVIEPVAR